jgi:predicted small lipoprotein YifL
MASSQLKRIIFLILLTAFVAACGRDGAPEFPPSVAGEAQPAAEEPVEDKPFVLDPLL